MCARPGVHQTNPLEKNMMNRIRTRIQSKNAADQMQGWYAWRPGPGRR